MTDREIEYLRKKYGIVPGQEKESGRKPKGEKLSFECEDSKEAYLEANESGMTDSEIAESMGLTIFALRYRKRKWKLHTRKIIDNEHSIKEYLELKDQAYTDEQIAIKWGYHVESIRKWRRKNNIDITSKPQRLTKDEYFKLLEMGLDDREVAHRKGMRLSHVEYYKTKWRNEQ